MPHLVNSRRAQKIGLLFLYAFLAILVALYIACFFASSPPSKPEPMSIEVVKVCSDENVCSDRAFLISGQVFQGTGEETLKFLTELRTKHPDINLVCFNSIGGDNISGAIISGYLAKSGLNTCLSTRYENLDGTPKHVKIYGCHSVCAWVVIGGKERIVFTSDVVVGFHGSRGHLSFLNCRCDTGPSLQEKDRFAELLRENSAARKDSKAELQAHLALLEWSFAQGFDRQTTPRELKLLLGGDHYFTADRRTSPDSPRLLKTSPTS